MRRLVYLSCFLLMISCITTFAQEVKDQQVQLNCAQSLRTARSTYDQGRLHEVTQWLTGCLERPEDANGFTEAERIEAYRMLTLTYIYLEEPEKADVEMINLLNTDHFYTVDDEVDPIEFKNLYRKFRSDPVYRIGAKIGFNTTHVNVLTNRYIWGQGKGEYTSTPGIQAAVVFEKDLKLLQKRLVLAPEIFWTNNSFTYTNTKILLVQPTDTENETPDTGQQEQVIAQTRLQLNALVQYKIEKTYLLADKFTPYVMLGPSVGYLMSSEFVGNTDADEPVTGTAIKNSSSYNPITLSVIAAAGIKLRVGGFYLTAELRHQYGFGNVVNTDNLYKNVDLMDHGYVDNDFRLSFTSFNIGFMLPHFSPKKLIK
jgi:hypothetical protein